jgi:hypothetical protein
VSQTVVDSKRWIIVALLLIVLAALAACTRGESEESAAGGEEPAKIEPVEGTDLSRITLTTKAAERIDVQTTVVRSGEGAETAMTVMPYSALVYDTEGRAWAYTSSDPLTFVRAPLTVERIEGDEVFLREGPPAGTPVVTVGAAELYGTELGVE